MGDVCASYSYWTFGDVFEETGVAYAPFSGCFGLLANGMIPKPTYYAFSFFKNLKETAIARSEHFVITMDEKGGISGTCWNPVEGNEDKDITLEFSLNLSKGDYMLVTKLVDENTCNPLRAWTNMGTPAYLNKEHLDLLLECARPQVDIKQIRVMDDATVFEIPLSSNGLCYFEIQQIDPKADRGFRPERIRGAI
jgi:xylan 1,4-beta-xylosidase